MASNLQRPQAIKEPFANSGDKNTIPVTDTGTQRASLDEGFPPVTGIPVSEGGIPPERKDMNALGYLTTSQYFYLQCGGRFTFDSEVSTAIGGYPAGAVLEYTDTDAGLSYAVISVINNNTYNFVTTPSYIDGSKWKKAFSEDLSNYVDRTTNQTVGGTKTFTSYIVDKTSIDLTDLSSTQEVSFLESQDKNGTVITRLRNWVNTSGIVQTRIRTLNSVYWADFNPQITSDGKYTIQTSCSSNTTNNVVSGATSSTSSSEIGSKGWVNNPATSTNVVHRSGDETIADGKTFTGICKFQGSGVTQWAIVKTTITKGTNPESTQECRMMVFDSRGTSSYKNLVGGIDIAQYSNGTIRTDLRAYKSEADGGTNANISIIYPASGDPYTEAPTPATSDNSTKIATTAFVNSRLQNLSCDFSSTGKTTLSLDLNTSLAFAVSGYLVITIDVKGQTDSIVTVLMSNTSSASSSSFKVCSISHNGGTAEHNNIPFSIYVEKGQSIYLNKTGGGSATVESAFIFATR